VALKFACQPPFPFNLRRRPMQNSPRFNYSAPPHIVAIKIRQDELDWQSVHD